MSDPFETLKRRGEEPAGPMLAPAEVRRRGDRLRRRRTAVRALGAACAVAAITTGTIALADGRTASSPTPPTLPPTSQDSGPTPDPTKSAEPRPSVTAIPAGFPLTEGYPADTGSDQQLTGPAPKVSAFGEVRACGGLAYPTVAPADRLAATFTQPEDFRSRELTTYADLASADRALTVLVEGFRACPRESFGGTPESVTVTEVRRTDLGDEGFVLLQTYETGLGLTQIHAVRVGNALLLSSTSNEGGGDARAVDAAVRADTDVLVPLADALCVFSKAGCSAG